jgi:hypothetical protein
MKRFLTVVSLFGSLYAYSQVGIGVTNPANSAMLEVSSTTKGLLPPRMAGADRNNISNPATGDLRNTTWTLTCTGFNIPLLNTITGIKLNVKAQRNGRIVDDIIQLTYQGSAIGANNFSYITDSEGHFLLLNDTYYGGEFDLWESEVTPSMLTDPSFGIILKFQSHPFYPHNCEMYLDSVSLTVYSV